MQWRGRKGLKKSVAFDLICIHSRWVTGVGFDFIVHRNISSAEILAPARKDACVVNDQAISCFIFPPVTVFTFFYLPNDTKRRWGAHTVEYRSRWGPVGRNWLNLCSQTFMEQQGLMIFVSFWSSELQWSHMVEVGVLYFPPITHCAIWPKGSNVGLIHFKSKSDCFVHLPFSKQCGSTSPSLPVMNPCQWASQLI